MNPNVLVNTNTYTECSVCKVYYVLFENYANDYTVICMCIVQAIIYMCVFIYEKEKETKIEK